MFKNYFANHFKSFLILLIIINIINGLRIRKLYQNKHQTSVNAESQINKTTLEILSQQARDEPSYYEPDDDDYADAGESTLKESTKQYSTIQKLMANQKPLGNFKYNIIMSSHHLSRLRVHLSVQILFCHIFLLSRPDKLN